MDALDTRTTEEKLIGALVHNPTLIDSVKGILLPGQLSSITHRAIYAGLLEMQDAGKTIDYEFVARHMKGRDDYSEQVLTDAYKSDFVDSYAVAYAQYIATRSMRRTTLPDLDKARNELMTSDNDTRGVLEELLDTVSNALRGAKRGYASVLDALVAWWDVLEARIGGKDAPSIASGLGELDGLIGGFVKSNLSIIGGRPGDGKSTLMLSIALELAQSGKRVGIFSMEMTMAQIVERLIVMVSGVPATRVLQATDLTGDELSRLVYAAGVVGDLPIWVDDNSQQTVRNVRTSVLQMQHDEGVDIVFVDYLQLMTPDANENGKRLTGEQGTASVSRGLTQIAKDLRLPVVALAQLRRDTGGGNREEKRPNMDTLRYSGQIEQDAYMVALLYRDELHNPATEFINVVEVIVAKHRNGPTGTAHLHFNKPIMKMSSVPEALKIEGIE